MHSTPKNIFPFLALMGAFLMLLPAKLHAQTKTTTTTAQAQDLKKSLQKMLDYQKEVNEALSAVNIIYDGTLTVEPQDGYYATTFPHIYISGPEHQESYAQENPPEKVVFDIGAIKMNLMPSEKPENWKATIVLPQEMTMYDALKGTADPDRFTLTFNEQRSIGLYNEKLGYFTKMDMNLLGLTFMTGEQAQDSRLGGVQFYTNLEEQENGRFSGPGHFLLSGLHIAQPDQDTLVEIGEIKLDFSMEDLKMPDITAYKEKILKHKETIQNLQLENPEEAQQINAQNIHEMVKDIYDFDMSGLSAAYSAKDISIKAPDNTTSQSADETPTRYQSTHLDNAKIGVVLSGLKTNQGTYGLELTYSGLKTTPQNPEMSDILPKELKTEITAQNIPYNSLGTLIDNAITSVAQNPETGKMILFSIVSRLPAIISQAGTQILVQNNKAANDIYNLTLNGNVTTDLSAMMGFKAQFNMLIEGLNTLIDVSQKHSQKEESPYAQQYKNLIPTLQTLKRIAKPATGADGKSAHSFVIETSDTGQFKINGQNISTVFAAPSSEQPEQPQ
ncbi:MAG: hypothetical protein ACLFP8_04500 [Alphaproteobacteria bacterium]